MIKIGTVIGRGAENPAQTTTTRKKLHPTRNAAEEFRRRLHKIIPQLLQIFSTHNALA
jgi:hypothetical protein